jgi:hypothetical protein
MPQGGHPAEQQIKYEVDSKLVIPVKTVEYFHLSFKISPGVESLLDKYLKT